MKEMNKKMEYKELNFFEKLSVYEQQTIENEHEVFTAKDGCCNSCFGDRANCPCCEDCGCCDCCCWTNSEHDRAFRIRAAEMSDRMSRH